jgi:hypothetical protein
MVSLNRTDSRVLEAGKTHFIDGNKSGSSRFGADVSLSRTLSGNWAGSSSRPWRNIMV